MLLSPFRVPEGKQEVRDESNLEAKKALIGSRQEASCTGPSPSEKKTRLQQLLGVKTETGKEGNKMEMGVVKNVTYQAVPIGSTEKDGREQEVEGEKENIEVMSGVKNKNIKMVEGKNVNTKAVKEVSKVNVKTFAREKELNIEALGGEKEVIVKTSEVEKEASIKITEVQEVNIKALGGEKEGIIKVPEVEDVKIMATIGEENIMVRGGIEVIKKVVIGIKNERTRVKGCMGNGKEKPKLTPSIEDWLPWVLRRPIGRSAVRVGAAGQGLAELMELLLEMAVEGGVLAASSRLIVRQLRLDLVFPSEEAAAEFCVKCELMELTLSSPLAVARVRVADLGYQFSPVLNEQELLRIHNSSSSQHCFSSPLLVDVELAKDRTGAIQAKFISVTDVNLFLQARGCCEEEISLGSLRGSGHCSLLSYQLKQAGKASHLYKLRVDRVLHSAVKLFKFYEEFSSAEEPIHLIFQSKIYLFRFLFSDIAKALHCAQLEVEVGSLSKPGLAFLKEAGVGSLNEVGVGPLTEKGMGSLMVRISRDLGLADPQLPPQAQEVVLTSEGLLPCSSLEAQVTGGREVTGLRYRKAGAQSSEWRGCLVKGGMVLPPRGGWRVGADFVVFAEGNTRKELFQNNKHNNLPVPEDLMAVYDMKKRLKELETRLFVETKERQKLEKKVEELETLKSTSRRPYPISKSPVKETKGDRQSSSSPPPGSLEVIQDPALVSPPFLGWLGRDVRNRNRLGCVR